jgi:hypothetical protein
VTSCSRSLATSSRMGATLTIRQGASCDRRDFLTVGGAAAAAVAARASRIPDAARRRGRGRRAGLVAIRSEGTGREGDDLRGPHPNRRRGRRRWHRPDAYWLPTESLDAYLLSLRSLTGRTASKSTASAPASSSHRPPELRNASLPKRANWGRPEGRGVAHPGLRQPAAGGRVNEQVISYAVNIQAADIAGHRHSHGLKDDGASQHTRRSHRDRQARQPSVCANLDIGNFHPPKV